VSGSRPQRTLIAYVDGPNEGPAEMVIIGGYRWKQSISWAALRWLPRLRFPRRGAAAEAGNNRGQTVSQKREWSGSALAVTKIDGALPEFTKLTLDTTETRSIW